MLFVTMKCDTHSCIKKHTNVDVNIILYKLPKDGAVRTVQINTVLKGTKQ